MKYDVIIIGAGPAGMAAAIQLKRSGLNPILIEKDRIGGALLNANRVENYLGFEGGIGGSKLAAIFQKHLEESDVSLRFTEVISLEYKKEMFRANTGDGLIQAPAAIVASGCEPLALSVPGESEMVGKQVFYELKNFPVRDNLTLAIIGSGDVAFDYALSLCQRAQQVSIIIRTEKARCLSLLEQEVDRTENTQLVYRAEVASIRRTEDGQAELQFKDDQPKPLSFDAILVAVGRQPQVSFLSPELMDENSTIPLYFAGDVVNGSFRQVGIAVGDGLRCAMDIAKRMQG